MFNNNPTGGGLFGQSNQAQNQPANNLFGGAAQNTQSTGLFGNNANNNKPIMGNTAGTSIFGNNAPQAGGLFQNGGMGAQQATQQGTQQGGQPGGLFGNNQQSMVGGGNNLFGGNQGQTGGTLFGGNTGLNMGATTTSGGLFGNNTMASGNSMFNRPNQSTLGYGQQTNQSTGNQIANEYLAFQNSLETTKMSLDACLSKMNARNLEGIRIDPWNQFKDRPLNKLPLKDDAVKIMFNFNQLKKATEGLKKSNQEIEKRIQNHSKDTHKKLALYKKCLLQTVSHNKLIDQVTSELQMMNRQMEDYFKPLYNAYKHKKKIMVKEPNDFDMKISYDVLNKLEILNQKVDDMIACEVQPTEEQLQGTVAIFEQLIQYFQNVSCSFREFSYKYNTLKRQAIEKSRRGNYETVMSKVAEKVEDNLKKEFKYYDLIKEIDKILAEKEAREEKKKVEALNKFDSMNMRRETRMY